MERAGLCSPNAWAYTSFMAGKSCMSTRNTVVLTTFCRSEPAAASTAWRLASTRSVCSLIPPPTISMVAGLKAICPAVNTRPLTMVAWL